MSVRVEKVDLPGIGTRHDVITKKAAGLFTEQLLISAGGTIVAIGTRPGLDAGNEFFTF